MTGKSLSRKLDRDFVTIYFMQGSRPEGKIAVRRISLILGIILIVFAAISFRVWQEMQVVKLGYEINQLRYEYNQALDRHRILLSQRNALASLDRIESIARLEKGLVSPHSGQLVFLVDPVAEHKSIGNRFINWLSALFIKNKHTTILNEYLKVG